MLHAKEKGQKVPEEATLRNVFRVIYGHKYPKQNLRKRCVMSANRTGQAYVYTQTHPYTLTNRKA